MEGFDTRLVLEVVKYASLFVATGLGLLNTAKETKHDGILTRWGKWSLAGIVVSGVLSLAAQVWQGNLDKKERQDAQQKQVEQAKRAVELAQTLSGLSAKTDDVNQRMEVSVSSLKDIGDEQKRLSGIQLDSFAEATKSLSPFEPVSLEAYLAWPIGAPEWKLFMAAVNDKVVQRSPIDQAMGAVPCSAVRQAGARIVGDLPFVFCRNGALLFVSGKPVELDKRSAILHGAAVSDWDFVEKVAEDSQRQNPLFLNDSRVMLSGPNIVMQFGPRIGELAHNDLNIDSVFDLLGKILTIDFGRAITYVKPETQVRLMGDITIRYGRNLSKRFRLGGSRLHVTEDRPLTFSTAIVSADLKTERSAVPPSRR